MYLENYQGKTLLMYACEKGRVELVRELIKKGADLEKTDSDGDNALLFAIFNYEDQPQKNLEIIKLLIDAGAKVNLDENSFEPLTAAISCADFKVVKLLVEAGAKISEGTENFHYQNSLNQALKCSKNPELAKYFLNLGLKVIPRHFQTAAEYQKDVEVIKLLIDKGCNVNQIGANGTTPLIEAIKNYEIVKFLLEQGAEPNLSKQFGMSALMYAIRDAEPKTVELLIKYGAEVNDRASDRDNWTPLMYAARYCQKTKTLELLLNAGAEINATEYYGWTALMLAAANSNKPQTVQLLIKRGADLNAVCRAGKTALIHCCESMGNTKVIKALLEAGAEVNIQDNDENTAFDMAVKNGNWEAVKLLKLYGAGQIIDENLPPLLNALRSQDIELMQKLLAQGVNQEEKNQALWEAAEQGNPEPVRILLDAGAEIESRNAYENTPLLEASYAEGRNKSAVIKELIERGADVNAKRPNLSTALMFAAIDSDHYAALKWLIDKGAEVNATDEWGRAAIHYAFFNEYNSEISFHKPTVERLIKAGANINQQDKEGMYPLAMAMDNYRNYDEDIEFLLKLGADPRLLDKKGWNSLFYAVKNHPNLDIAILLNAGVDKNHKDNGGWTALYYAALMGDDFKCKCLGVNKTPAQIVKKLLKKGKLNPNSLSAEGFTPLFYPIDNNNLKIVKLLVKAGADINSKLAEKFYGTALEYAIREERTELAEYLIKKGAKINKIEKYIFKDKKI